MSCQQIPTAWLWLCVLNLLHFTNTPSSFYPAFDRVVKSIPVFSCITSVDRTTSSSSRRYRYTTVQHIRGYLHPPSIVSFGYGPPDVFNYQPLTTKSNQVRYICPALLHLHGCPHIQPHLTYTPQYCVYSARTTFQHNTRKTHCSCSLLHYNNDFTQVLPPRTVSW